MLLVFYICIMLLDELLYSVENGLCSIFICCVLSRLVCESWFWLLGMVVGMLFISICILCMLKVECVLKLWIDSWVFCV